MGDKFQNKYRIPSARLQNWDYANEGMYFITVCTKDRMHYFGEIENGKMMLSNVGVLADLMWYEIKNHAHGIELGEFVVMPNHIHGILILNGENDGNNGKNNVNGNNDGYIGAANGTANVGTTRSNVGITRSNVGTTHANVGITHANVGITHDVETTHALSLQSQPHQPQPHHDATPTKTIGQQRFQNQGKNSVSSIIGGYKSAVTKHANRLGLEFEWQPRFYDHIIRDANSFDTITHYIINNPANWANDKFYENE